MFSLAGILDGNQIASGKMFIKHFQPHIHTPWGIIVLQYMHACAGGCKGPAALCLIFRRDGFALNHLGQFSFKFAAGQHDNPAATLTLYFNVSAHASHFPMVAATGMLFFHAHNVAQIKCFPLHLIPPKPCILYI